MSTGIKIKIDVKKIIKQYLFEGQKGTYLDCVLWENKDGVDEYGNSHSLQQDIPKDARDRGEKAPYIGNGKWLQTRNSGGNQRQQSQPAQSRPPQQGPKSWDKPKPTGVPPTQNEWGEEPLDESQIPF